MMRAVSWLLAACLVAVATHIAYVLFVPQYEMSRLIGAASRSAGINRFAVLDSAEQELLLKESGRSALAGWCPFDLDEGMLVFDAALPDAIWSFTVYEESGNDAYAINEAQAGTNRFRLTVKKSPGLLGLIWGDERDTAAIDDGWTISMPSRRGLAVLWVALDDRSLRMPYSEMMKKSACRIEQES